MADGEETAHEVGFWLNDVMLSAVTTDEVPGYGKPVEAFKELAAKT